MAYEGTGQLSTGGFTDALFVIQDACKGVMLHSSWMMTCCCMLHMHMSTHRSQPYARTSTHCRPPTSWCATSASMRLSEVSARDRSRASLSPMPPSLLWLSCLVADGSISPARCMCRRNLTLSTDLQSGPLREGTA
jgi:hypothetical protein